MREFVHSALLSYARHFPLQKGKSRAVSLLWRATTPGPHIREGTLKQANVRLRCDLAKYLQRQLYFFGSYERSTCEYWMQRAATARVVFDVGANAGLYTLLAAAVNPNVEIHAFEPTSELVECLMDNLRLNNLKSVTVNPVAVCSYTGEAYLHRFTGGDNGDNDGTNFVNDDPQGAACRTKAVSLDEYCSGKGIQQIDLLKLDIEGGELDALAGARNLLAARAIGCIVVELIEWAANRAGHSTRDIKELLAGCGYGVYVLDGNALQPISQDAIHDGDNVIVLPSQSA